MDEYIVLSNEHIRLYLLPMGATIYKLFTKNRVGVFENIILSFSNLNAYNKNDAYFGTTCGRFAGRIVDGICKIDHQTYELYKNEAPHCLHGGKKGLSFQKWDYRLEESDNEKSCIFSISSRDLEEGFPGDVNISVRYTIVENKLIIKYDGYSNVKTFLNLTNHSYFNLTGKDEQIYNHKLLINANEIAFYSSTHNVYEVLAVENTYFDFNKMKKLGNLSIVKEKLLVENKGLDHSFLLSKSKDYDLELIDETSGRSLLIKTSYPSIVVYSYNFLTKHDIEDKNNRLHIGLAIECQYVPNSINQTNFDLPFINTDNPYDEEIIYEFKLIE